MWVRVRHPQRHMGKMHRFAASSLDALCDLSRSRTCRPLRQPIEIDVYGERPTWWQYGWVTTSGWFDEPDRMGKPRLCDSIPLPLCATAVTENEWDLFAMSRTPTTPCSRSRAPLLTPRWRALLLCFIIYFRDGYIIELFAIACSVNTLIRALRKRHAHRMTMYQTNFYNTIQIIFHTVENYLISFVPVWTHWS